MKANLDTIFKSIKATKSIKSVNDCFKRQSKTKREALIDLVPKKPELKKQIMQSYIEGYTG